MKGRKADKEIIHCDNVAVQDRSPGGACGQREEGKGCFLLLYLKWEGGMQ